MATTFKSQNQYEESKHEHINIKIQINPGQDRVWDLATRIGAFLNIPVIIGAITMVHWGRWNFVPTEAYPMGGMEFQAVLLLLLFYLAITGNQGTAPVGSQTAA